MPGYEKCRFANLSQTEEEEFTCGICLEILQNPIVVPCCRHTYCYDCINEWLNNKSSCPNDRTPLLRSELYNPQRLVLNLLAKLQIHCDFNWKGCNAILDLECLALHVMNCKFNPERKCIDCGMRRGEEPHHCIDSLKAINSELNNEMIELKNEIQKLKEEIESLRENRNEYNHISEVMASARRRISYPEITYCSIPSTLRMKAINKSREAIQLFDSYSEISRFLNSEFNSDSNQKWYAITHAIHCGESMIVNENGYIDLRFGELRITIFCAGSKMSSLTTTAIIMNSTSNNI